MSLPYEAIVIGTSAGAVEALSALLPRIPVDFPVPVLVVVHLPADKKSVIAELMQEKCKVKVREAEDKEPLEPGTVYFAPPDYHVLIEADRSICLTVEEPVLYSRPSIDVLFESAAEIYGDKLLGIVLTGANTDGARGLRAIMDGGGMGIVQDPHSSSSPMMPEAALKACPKAHMMDLDHIGLFLEKGGSV